MPKIRISDKAGLGCLHPIIIRRVATQIEERKPKQKCYKDYTEKKTDPTTGWRIFVTYQFQKDADGNDDLYIKNARKLKQKNK